MISGRTLGAAVTLLLIAGSYWATFDHGRSLERAAWETRWAQRDAADSEASAHAEANAREEEQRRQAAQQESRDHAQKEQSAADIDAAGADAGGQRLRDEAARLAASVSCAGADPAAVARGQAATRAAMVLSELLERSVTTNRELAAAYDRARIAGGQCEREYSALQPPN